MARAAHHPAYGFGSDNPRLTPAFPLVSRPLRDHDTPPSTPLPGSARFEDTREAIRREAAREDALRRMQAYQASRSLRISRPTPSEEVAAYSRNLRTRRIVADILFMVLFAGVLALFFAGVGIAISADDDGPTEAEAAQAL